MADWIIGYSRCDHTRAALEAHGHTVWTCDLLFSDHPRHLQGDIWDILDAYEFDRGIFHPMCTYLNVASAWALKDPDFDRYPGVGYHQKVKPETLTGATRREKQAAEIENFKRLDALPFPHAIENPSPSMVSKSHRPADQTVHPYMFGDDASKGTGLWLKDLPPLIVNPADRCAGRMVDYKGKTVERWSNQTDSGQNRLTPGADRWLERSATYPGIAAAFGQWGAI